MARPIRVLVVDDSALIRKLMTEILDADPGIEVVGTAADPFIAREKIKQLSPDVLTLDVEMPRMDGLTFLRNLMRLRPMPVVMVSSLTEQGATVTLDALAAGAVDFVTKPKIDVARTLAGYAELLVEKVKDAARARVHVIDDRAPPAPDRPESRTPSRGSSCPASTAGSRARHAPPARCASVHLPAAARAHAANEVNHLAGAGPRRRGARELRQRRC